MEYLTQIKYKYLYLVWAVLFAATAVLGLIFPVAEGALKTVFQIISVLFFVPPWVILQKAQAEEVSKHRKLIRNLSLASLIGTVILVCASFLTVGQSEVLGNVLHAALTVVSAPMICSNMYILPLFLWAMLLMGSLSRPAGK